MDNDISNDTASDTTKQLVIDVKAFHEMRQSLCESVFESVENNTIFFKLAEARGVIQYDVAPENSTCDITKSSLCTSDGLTIVVKGKKMICFVVHRRFKTLLYNFWYIVHFQDELNKDSHKWLQTQQWWLNMTDSDVAANIITYNDNMFAKRTYVKLVAACKYIQTDMVSLPINK